MTQRRRYSAEFKARVALEALKGHKTVTLLLDSGVFGSSVAREGQSLFKAIEKIRA
jgi:transposase-like protein